MKYVRFMNDEGEYDMIVFSNEIEHRETARMMTEVFGDAFHSYLMPADAGFIRRGKEFKTYDQSDTLKLSHNPEAGVNFSKALATGEYGFIQTIKGFLLTDKAFVDRIASTPPWTEKADFPLLCGHVKVIGETEILPKSTPVEVTVTHNPQDRVLESKVVEILGRFFSYL